MKCTLFVIGVSYQMPPLPQFMIKAFVHALEQNCRFYLRCKSCPYLLENIIIYESYVYAIIIVPRIRAVYNKCTRKSEL